jgi:hypothetical protein
MKYKIIKKQSKSLKVIYPHIINGKDIPESTSVKTSEWYEAKRKGKIFGFWHKVGHESGYEGERISHTTNTLDEMKNYIRNWHEVNYGDKYKCEIVEKMEL